MLLLGKHQAHDVGACTFFEMQMLAELHCTWLGGLDCQVEVIPTGRQPNTIIMSLKQKNNAACTGLDLLFEG